MITDDNETFELVVALLSALGALNWGLVELLETNLLADTLGIGGDPLMYAYTAIGVAGAIVLIDLVDDSEVLS